MYISLPRTSSRFVGKGPDIGRSLRRRDGGKVQGADVLLRQCMPNPYNSIACLSRADDTFNGGSIDPPDGRQECPLVPIGNKTFIEEQSVA